MELKELYQAVNIKGPEPSNGRICRVTKGLTVLKTVERLTQR